MSLNHYAATVNVETRSQTRELRAGKLLVATGRRPNPDRIAIEKPESNMANEGQVRVDEFLRTNGPHIFAGRDVIGRESAAKWPREWAVQDGCIAAHTAFTRGSATCTLPEAFIRGTPRLQ
jgi:mercuric reductase